MRFTLHARIEIAIVATVLLSSCTPEWEDRLDVADVNARNALYRVNELASRIDELESGTKARELEGRIADIESRLNM